MCTVGSAKKAAKARVLQQARERRAVYLLRKVVTDDYGIHVGTRYYVYVDDLWIEDTVNGNMAAYTAKKIARVNNLPIYKGRLK